MACDESNRIAALRDFFAATDAEELRAAYARLTTGSCFCVSDYVDWREVEYEFNRLFVGPMKLAAPPYASVYMEPEPQLMGQVTLEVRNLYRKLGIAVPQEGQMPDDHIAYELDAMLMLTHLAAVAADGGLDATHALELANCRAWLLEHMRTWVPQFAHHVLAVKDVSAPIALSIGILLDWMGRPDSENGVAQVHGERR